MHKTTSGIMLILLVIGLPLFSWHITLVKAESRTWIVDDDGPADFSTIQEAINNANDGDTILVSPGTYYENVVVNKTIELIGEDSANTILDGGGANCIVTMASNGSYISGFTITNGTVGVNVGDGYLNNACGTSITGNYIADVLEGIWVGSESSNTSISMNNMDVSVEGIEIQSCYNTLYGNNVTGNGEYGVLGAYSGISVDPWDFEARDNNISRNRIRNCTNGILLDNSGGLGGIDNTLLEGNDIADSDYGIYVWGCPYNDIIGNNIAANREAGIALIIVNLGHYGYWPSKYNTLSGNNITNNHYGILISGCWNNEIVSNFLSGNVYGMGLHWAQSNDPYDDTIYYSHDNTIVENTVTTSTICEIEMKNASDNYIYHNNFLGNNPVYSENSTNLWDNGYPSGGNYWSDYPGVDANRDGIGDTPYVIDANNQDRYPLMYRFGPLRVRNINTGLDYDTIQEAINHANARDIIFVRKGIYHEEPVINKSLTLIGEDRDLTVVNGCFLIQSSGLSISNFTISVGRDEYGWIGIYHPASEGEATSSNVTICDNIILGSPEYTNWGVYIGSGFNYTIHNNIIQNRSGGICIYRTSRSQITGNKISNCYSTGICIWAGSKYNVIADNRVEGIIRNPAIIPPASGINLEGGEGAEGPVTGNIVRNNTVIQCCYALNLGILSGNIFYNNFFLWSSLIWEPVPGPLGPNIWDDGYPNGGNFWPNYSGIDEKSGPSQDQPGSDGIGDTPYVIDANNIDRYPLVFPDIAVTEILLRKTIIAQGYQLNLTVVAANQGPYDEDFNLTVYANTTEIWNQAINLSSQNSTQITVQFNTDSSERGNYIISANVTMLKNEE